jgi:RHS repeat-associated protein
VVRANNFSLGLSSGGQATLVASTPVNAIVDVVGYFAFDSPTWTVTFRDESNRLASDYTISGSVTRAKNYFYFGNLLVATRDSGGNYLYYASDHLGTPRQVTNGVGQVTETHKYQPFGAEIGGSFGNQPLKFASMERDVSSGNDFDHARYQSSPQGRFLAPDLVGGKPDDPQTWNRYAYARNNPIKFVDRDGLEFGYPGQQEELDRVGIFQATQRGDEFYFSRVVGFVPIREGMEETLGPINTLALYATGARPAIHFLRNIYSILPAPAAEEVSDPRLQRIINQLYKPSDTMPGGTAGALEYEARNPGVLVGGKSHFTKAQQRLNQLTKYVSRRDVDLWNRFVAQRYLEALRRAIERYLRTAASGNPLPR